MEGGGRERDLGRTTTVTPDLRRFLDENIRSADDLPAATSLAAQLREEHSRLHADLCSLLRRLSASIALWDSRSCAVRDSLRHLSTHLLHSQGDRDGVEGAPGEDMTQLAGEVGRIQSAHRYIDTVLHLETLVGDLEDAALSYMGHYSATVTARSDLNVYNPTDFDQKQEKLQMSIKSLNIIEDVLVDTAKHQPNWDRLFAVVDSRVEQIIGFIRPQALREYRLILLSCGWPPSFDVLLEKERKKELTNTFLSMDGNKWHEFSTSFLSLCALQHHRDCQKTRKLHSLACKRGDLAVSLEINKTSFCLDDNLWAIEELVDPLLPRLEHHFSKWSSQPKFIFALVYRITQEFLGSIDNVLQPLMDKARLVRYSAKEAWVSAMLKVLSGYLKSRTFPVLLENYEADVHNAESVASWLNLVDLIIESDKRMQALASTGIQLKGHLLEFDGGSILNLLVSIFHDQPEWLQIWGEIELRDVEEKLKSEIENEKSWKIENVREEEFISRNDDFLLSTREDCKAPLIADSVIRTASVMIERGRALPSIEIRAKFIKLSACILMDWFYKVLLQRYEETKSVFTAMEEEFMIRLVGAVNTARYCETVMQGWSEDVMLLEQASDRKTSNSDAGNEMKARSFLFQDEMEKMIKLQTDCLLDMVSTLLLKFDSCSRAYIQGMQYLEFKNEVDMCIDESLNVSNEFVEALQILKEWLSFLKCNLNSWDFADLWRSLAGGLDHFVFNSVILANLKYGHSGLEQFKVDMKALYFVFRPFCLRPEAFFPCVSDSLKLLSIRSEEVELLMGNPSKGDKLHQFLKSSGLFHITPKHAKKLFGKTISSSGPNPGAGLR